MLPEGPENLVFRKGEMESLLPTPYHRVSQETVSEFCAKHQIPNDGRLKIAFVVSVNSAGVGYYRAVQPAHYLNKLMGDKVIAIVTESVQTEIVNGWADVVVFGRATNPVLWILAKHAKAVTVFETDDFLHGVDPENSAHGEWNPEHSNYWWSTEMRDVCKAVQVSTGPLLDYYGKGKPSAILENTVDPDLLNFPQQRIQDGVVRLGWAGSQTHVHDLNVVGPTLLKLKRQYKDRLQIVTMGFNGVYVNRSDGLERDVLYGVEREHRDGESIRTGDYYHRLAELNLDMAIAPLKDTPFNRCKSNLKMLEFGALGLPMCVSSVEPYMSFPGAVWRAESTRDWERMLGVMIDTADGRYLLGRVLRENVAERFDVKKRIHEYYDFYRTL